MPSLHLPMRPMPPPKPPSPIRPPAAQNAHLRFHALKNQTKTQFFLLKILWISLKIHFKQLKVATLAPTRHPATLTKHQALALFDHCRTDCSHTATVQSSSV
jgi:hypothetical protein